VLVLGSGGGPRRLSLFHYDGTFQDSWPQYSSDRFRITPLGGAGSEWLASVRHPVDPSGMVPGGIWVDTAWVHPFSPGNGALSAEIVGSPGQALILGSRGEASAGPLFDPWPRIATDTLGFIFRTQGEEYRIDVFNLNGALVRRITRSHSPRAISQELLEDFETRVRGHYRTLGGGPRRDEEMERIIETRVSLIRVDHLPPTGRLLVGPAGTCWVERRDLDESPGLREFERSFGRVTDEPKPTTWEVFESSGAYSASVQLPEAFEPHVVSENSVLGVLRDELDVEYVVRFVIDRG